MVLVPTLATHLNLQLVALIYLALTDSQPCLGVLGRQRVGQSLCIFCCSFINKACRNSCWMIELLQWVAAASFPIRHWAGTDSGKSPASSCLQGRPRGSQHVMTGHTQQNQAGCPSPSASQGSRNRVKWQNGGVCQKHQIHSSCLAAAVLAQLSP